MSGRVNCRAAAYLNKPVELTGHSVGFFSFTTVITSGQQLTGGVRLQSGVWGCMILSNIQN
jgi:hypothetical protein